MAKLRRPIDPNFVRRSAFDLYLRTGRRLVHETLEVSLERKFNPYHDPRNGQFTFAPGGPRSLTHVMISDRRRVLLAGQDQAGAGTATKPEAPGRLSFPSNPTDFGIGEPVSGKEPSLRLVNYRPNPRARIGNNNGPPLNDPVTLIRVFPGLANAPGGSLVAIADNILNLSGPSQQLTTGLAGKHVNVLINQIRRVDPNYRLDSFGFPQTMEGRSILFGSCAPNGPQCRIV